MSVIKISQSHKKNSIQMKMENVENIKMYKYLK